MPSPMLLLGTGAFPPVTRRGIGFLSSALHVHTDVSDLARCNKSLLLEGAVFAAVAGQLTNFNTCVGQTWGNSDAVHATLSMMHH